MKNQLLLFIFLITTLTSFAQSKRANIWYQSYGVGLDFNCNPPCAVESPAIQECWSTATICAKDGNLQFYTNNENIWNSDHQVMENGTDLYTCRWSRQGSLIVPITSNPYQYYLVTCDNIRYPTNQQYTPPYACLDINPFKHVLSLHLIDMGANGGKGTVLWKNKVIYGNGSMNSMLAAVKHANTKDTWLMTYDINTNRFISLLLTDCGIQDTVIAPALDITFIGSNPITFSPKGDLFNVNNGFGPNQKSNMVTHFNTVTGEISGPVYFEGNIVKGCFSADSKYLYAMDPSFKICRFEFPVTDTAHIFTNRELININPADGYCNGIQNGPDDKLYFNCAQNYLTWNIFDDPSATVQSSPRRLSTPVSKPYNSMPFSTIANFVQSWFDPDFKEYEYGSPSISYQRVCVGNKTTLVAHGIPPVTPWHWEIKENNLPVSYYYNEDTITHLFAGSGFHTVNLVIDFSCMPDVITKNDILVDGKPIPNYMKDTTVCEGSSAVISAEPNMVSYQWNTGGANQQESATVDNTYIVQVSNTCGSITDSITLTKIEYAVTNLVTQNQDGMNETLNIKSNTIAPGQLEIYNNWGSRIYFNKSYENTWPEKEEEAGVYFYRYALSTCKATKGWVQVTH